MRTFTTFSSGSSARIAVRLRITIKFTSTCPAFQDLHKILQKKCYVALGAHTDSKSILCMRSLFIDFSRFRETRRNQQEFHTQRKEYTRLGRVQSREKNKKPYLKGEDRSLNKFHASSKYISLICKRTTADIECQCGTRTQKLQIDI